MYVGIIAVISVFLLAIFIGVTIAGGREQDRRYAEFVELKRGQTSDRDTSLLSVDCEIAAENFRPTNNPDLPETLTELEPRLDPN